MIALVDIRLTSRSNLFCIHLLKNDINKVRINYILMHNLNT